MAARTVYPDTLAGFVARMADAADVSPIMAVAAMLGAAVIAAAILSHIVFPRGPLGR